MSFSEKAKLTALAIVHIFETGKPLGRYDAVAVLNDGAGISYGASQFTHRSGSLFAVLDRYFKLGGRLPEIVLAAMPSFQSGRNIATCSSNVGLKTALARLGTDQLMQRAQREIAFEKYLQPAILACEGSNFVQPLSLAVVYDSQVHGSWAKIRDRVRLDPGQFMAPAHFEKAWITEYVEQRDRWLESIPRLAPTDYRTDFFLAQIGRNNWNLDLPMTVHGRRLASSDIDAPGIQDIRPQVENSEPPSVSPPSEIPQEPQRPTEFASAETRPADDPSSVADEQPAVGSLGGYLDTAQQKFDGVEAFANGVARRADSAKSLWTTLGGTLTQIAMAVAAMFAGVPREVWITVAIIAGVLTTLYLYRQISLGKIRELAKHGLGAAAERL